MSQGEDSLNRSSSIDNGNSAAMTADIQRIRSMAVQTSGADHDTNGNGNPPLNGPSSSSSSSFSSSSSSTSNQQLMSRHGQLRHSVSIIVDPVIDDCEDESIDSNDGHPHSICITLDGNMDAYNHHNQRTTSRTGSSSNTSFILMDDFILGQFLHAMSFFPRSACIPAFD